MAAKCFLFQTLKQTQVCHDIIYNTCSKILDDKCIIYSNTVLVWVLFLVINEANISSPNMFYTKSVTPLLLVDR